MSIVWDAPSQCPKIECSRFCKIQSKANCIKVGFHTSGSLFYKQLEVMIPSHIDLHVNLTNCLLITMLLNCMHIHFICVCVFIQKMVLIMGPSFMNRKMTEFGFLCNEIVHLIVVLGEQLFCNICNKTHVDFAHPFWLHPSPILIFLGFLRCSRGFICSCNCFHPLPPPAL